MQTHVNIPYTQTPQGPQHLNLFLPDEIKAPLPVVVWFVGGGWRKCDYQWGPDWLAQHGFAVVSVQYRITSIAPGPACIHDAKAAIRWVRAQAAKYQFDPRRVGAFGSSAGAHLTLLLALTPGFAPLEGDGGYPEYSSAITSFAEYCGPTDLPQLVDPQLAASVPGLIPPVEGLIGGTVAQKLDIAKLYSPITYVSANCPPGLMIHGMKDPIVPVEDTTRLHALLKAAGAPDVSMILLEGQGHGWADKTLSEPQVLEHFKRTMA